MKRSWLFWLFFISCFTVSTGSQCVQGFFKFKDETCFENNANGLPLNDLINGKVCQEIACTGYINVIKSYICIWPRKYDIKLMFYGSARNSTYDIPLNISEADTYTVKQIAVSEKHMSLLIISEDCAYRMAFFIDQLGLINSFKLYYMGSADTLVWQPFYDFDVYMQIINGETIHTEICSHNSGQNISSYNSLEQCPKWNDKRTVDLQRISFTSAPLTSLPWINGERIFFILLIVVVLIGSILLTVYFKKYRKSEATSNNAVPNINLVDTNGIQVDSPPPPYVSPERFERLESQFSSLSNLMRRYVDSQQTQNNSSVSREAEEMVPLTSDNSLKI